MSALTIIERLCAAEGSAHEAVWHSSLSRVWGHVPRGVEPACRVFSGQAQPNKTSRSNPPQPCWQRWLQCPRGLIHELLRRNHPYARRPEADEQHHRDSYVQHGIDHGVPLPTLRAWRLDLQEMAGIFTSMTHSLVVGSALKHEPQSNKVHPNPTGLAQRQPFRPAYFSEGRRASQQNWGRYMNL